MLTKTKFHMRQGSGMRILNEIALKNKMPYVYDSLKIDKITENRIFQRQHNLSKNLCMLARNECKSYSVSAAKNT